MEDVEEIKAYPLKETQEQNAREQKMDVGTWTQVVGQDQTIIPVKSLEGMNSVEEEEEKPSSFKKKKLKSKRRDERSCIIDGAGVDEAEDVIQDQIIIAPEIMNMILGELDLKSLKICRLVCKSWLQEAQVLLERRAVVRFQRKGCTARLKSFGKELQSGLLRSFRQPYLAVGVDLCAYVRITVPPYKQFLKDLPGILSPPLVLTRFSPADVPFQLALPLILQCSLSLEYLRLEAGSSDKEYLPPMDPAQSFPNLRHFKTEMSTIFPRPERLSIHFPSIVAGIANASPKLEAWESNCVRIVDIGSELLLKVNIKNVKSLVLEYYRFNKAASEHFLSIPFSRLEHLKLDQVVSEDSVEWEYHALLATVSKSTGSLKKLDLSDADLYLSKDLIRISSFPVCPNVKELSLGSWHYWMGTISKTFPAIRVLNISRVNMTALGTVLPPFFGIKTLRATCYADSDELSIRFLEKFPDLERLRLDIKTLLGCCRLLGTGNPRFSNAFKSVKHLELENVHLFQYHYHHSPLGVLQGIERITVVSSSRDIGCIPFQCMPSLKVLEFSWERGLKLDMLLEVARKRERVVVTNCCSIPRAHDHDQKSKDLLKAFFESASNAECGCGKNSIK